MKNSVNTATNVENKMISSFCYSCVFYKNKKCTSENSNKSLCLINLYKHKNCTEQSEYLNYLNSDFGLYITELQGSSYGVQLESFDEKGKAATKRGCFLRRNKRNTGSSGYSFKNLFKDTELEDVLFHRHNSDNIIDVPFTKQEMYNMLIDDEDYGYISEEQFMHDKSLLVRKYMLDNDNVINVFAACVLWAVSGTFTAKRKILSAILNYSTSGTTVISDKFEFLSDSIPISFSGDFNGKDLANELNALIINQKKSCYLITGCAGSGKSSCMQAIASVNKSVLYIQLASFDKYETLSNSISFDIKAVIFDGFDELGIDNQSLFLFNLSILSKNHNCNFIITSRIDIPVLNSTILSYNVYKLTPEPLSEEKIYSYLNINVSNLENEKRYKNLDSHLKELLTVPLYLVKFKELWNTNRELNNISCINDLFDMFYYREIKKQGRKSLLLSKYISDFVMPYCAFSLYTTNITDRRSIWSNIRAFYSKCCESDDFMYALESDNIEVPCCCNFGNKLIDEMINTFKILKESEDDISFEHLKVKDYFCSKYISNVIKLSLTQVDTQVKLNIIMDSGIASIRWSNEVCELIGKEISVESVYSTESITAKLLDLIRNKLQENTGYMLYNIFNAVICACGEKGCFENYDFNGLDFSEIRLNGIDFINCDFRNTIGINYDNLRSHGHTGEIVELMPQCDGNTFVSIGMDEKVIMWDIKYGLPIYTTDFKNYTDNYVVSDIISKHRKKTSPYAEKLKRMTSERRILDYYVDEQQNRTIAITDLGLYVFYDNLNIYEIRTVWDSRQEKIRLQKLVYVDGLVFIVSNSKLYRIDIDKQLKSTAELYIIKQNEELRNKKDHFTACEVFSSQFNISSICICKTSHNYVSIIIGDVCGGIYELVPKGPFKTTNLIIKRKYPYNALWLVTKLIPLENEKGLFLAVPPERDEVRLYAPNASGNIVCETNIKISYESGKACINNMAKKGESVIFATSSGTFRVDIDNLLSLKSLELTDCEKIYGSCIDVSLWNNGIAIISESQSKIVFDSANKRIVEIFGIYDESKLSIAASGSYLLFGGEIMLHEGSYNKPIEWAENMPAIGRAIKEAIFKEKSKSDIELPTIPKFVFLDDINDDKYLICISDDSEKYQIVVMKNQRFFHQKGQMGFILHAVLNEEKGTILFSNHIGHVIEYYYKTGDTIEFALDNNYQRTFAYYGCDDNHIIVSLQSKKIIAFELPTPEDCVTDKKSTTSMMITDHFNYSYDEIKSFHSFYEFTNISGLNFQGSVFSDSITEDLKQIISINGGIAT